MPFTTLPNALGHLNSLYGGDNWAKCSTVMYPVWLLVACFFMMDRLVVWTEVLRPLLLNKSGHTHLYFDSVTEEWKTLQRSPDQNTEINDNKKKAIWGQGQNKRAESVLEQCKENKGREPGGTSASLDCGPKWQLTAAALTSWASRCGSNFPNAATLNFTLVLRSLCSTYLHVIFRLIHLLNCITPTNTLLF